MTTFVTEEQVTALSQTIASAIKAGISLSGDALPTPTAENQTLVSKLVDGKLVAVWQDNNVVTPPVANQLVFSDLQNCTYANDTLTYTSGDLDIIGAAGYQAVSDKPVDIIFEASSNINLFVGDGNNLDGYLNGMNNGVVIGIPNGGDVVNALTGDTVLQVIANEVITVKLSDRALTITNKRTGQTWTSPQSDYLATPKYMGAVVIGTDPLTIKAI